MARVAAYDQAVGGRTSVRHRVHLSVRYTNASEFVREYAENLSVGGLFIAGAADLQPLELITVEIDLPGMGRFRVQAEVAHVMDPELAARVGATAGAGLAIRNSPPDFEEALSRYLHRLGARADNLVLVAEDTLRTALSEAGYLVAVAPDPAGLTASVARSEAPVLAIIVPRSAGEDYRAAASAAGDDELVMLGDSPRDLPTLLAALDLRL